MWTYRRSGQTNQRGPQDHRTPYMRDKTRVIHCPAFRRLQRKTQILGTNEGDFHRTRLTHSLEVASIGSSIVHSMSQNNPNSPIIGLLPQEDLINVICLLHDIGHPPFGHGGETALNYMMHKNGGFESNAQTLRLLTKIENSYGEFGLDLTRRTLFGILKYPISRSRIVASSTPQIQINHSNAIRINDWLPPKAYYDCEQPEVDWLLSPFSASDATNFQSLIAPPQEKKHGKSAFKGFDCSIMNAADDIAYGVHDLEDAIHLKLVHREQFDSPHLQQLLKETSLENTPELINNLFDKDIANRKQAVGEMVNYFINSSDIIQFDDFEDNLLKYNVALKAEAQALLDYLMQYIFQFVIDSQEARTLEYGGQMVVLRLFEAISTNPLSLLDIKSRILYQNAQDASQALRVVCDYIANMTDEYAHHMHERLFGFNNRTIFD